MQHQDMGKKISSDGTIGYLVHDLNDAAVARRVNLLTQGGAQVRIGGFRRRVPPVQIGAADPIVDLGATRDMRLGQRVLAIVKNLVRPAKARKVVTGADAIVARNLEMLAIAVWTRIRGQHLIYECLDIHRMMLSERKAGQILRMLERWLIARCSLIITSSPAYADLYFRARQGYDGQILLIENKVPFDAPQALPPSHLAPETSSPRRWRIGWFGIIRCRKSLTMLASICAESSGRIEVVIAGRPNLTEIPDFHDVVASAPGLTFIGPYQLDQLPALYASIDLAWAVDFYEEGLNSSWLLPNRLYESLSAGVPPLAIADVEVGRWLDRENVGRTFVDLKAEVLPFMLALTQDAYEKMRSSVANLPVGLTRFHSVESKQIVQTILASKPTVNGQEK